MYHSYFGLKEQVFSIAVDPRYLYMSRQHREALAHLLYGVNSGGFVLLTGEVGTGKTTIVRCLLEQLPANTELAVVLNPVASAPELLGNICDEFRIAYEPGENSIKMLMDKLYHHLLGNHTRGRNTVLLIDEAQLLRISTLEQIRLLTNLETNEQKLLQIILVGQPELNRILAKPNLRQLSQRITARYHLRALTLEETQAYISHRLHVAGMKVKDDPFPAEIIRAIHDTSRGIPRLINVLCDRMLLGAYSQNKVRVDERICRQARLEVLGEEHLAQPPERNHRPRRVRYWSGWAAAACLAAVLVWQLWPAGQKAPLSSAVPVAAAEKAPTAQASETGLSFGRVGRVQALADLFEYLQLAPEDADAPCKGATASEYGCERERLTTWTDLRQLNRPAVLRLITPAKHESFATLVSLKDDSAKIVAQGEHHQVSLAELGPLWTGEITYVWRKPAFFDDAVGYGARGELVTWLAEQFAVLDDQKKPLTEDLYNQALVERVKIFQRNHKLAADGVFGVRTLMALNERLGITPTLSSPASSAGTGLTQDADPDTAADT